MEAKEELQSEVKKLKPKADYVDKVLDSVDSFTTTSIAKELGMTAIELNRLLVEKKIQYYHEGTYLLYAEYARKNYTKSRTHTYFGSNNEIHTKHYTTWTEQGRLFIHTISEPLVLK